MATIYDLFEISSISEHTTYSSAAGNLLGVVDNVDSADLNDGEFDEGDTVLIGGVTYTIDLIQEPSSSGRFTQGDGTDLSFNPQSESNLDAVFLTLSNGGDVRYFVIPSDTYGDMNVKEIRTGSINDVAGNDAALVSTTDDNVNVVCFAANTMIQTPSGDVPVERLKIGDPVWTRDHGMQDVRYIISRNIDFNSVSDHLKPIVFEPDSLGPGRPNRRLLVSPQHRILVTTKEGNTVLVPAKALTKRKGVRVARGKRKVTYFHLVFSGHEIILANDTLTESLFPGPMALKAVPRRCRAEIEDIFGRPLLDEINHTGVAAAPMLSVQETRRNALTFN